jgi:hypothetical protein
VLAWALLHSYGVTSGEELSIRPALELFDTLRLRHSLARAFAELGLAGEDCWRAAGRVRILLQRQLLAEVQPKSASPTPSAAAEGAAQPGSWEASKSASAPNTTIWDDPDWRWLTGVHEANGHTYIRKEPYAEVLWWTQLPALIETGSKESTPPGACVELTTPISRALEDAEAAGYDLDRLLFHRPMYPAASESAGPLEGEFKPSKE